MRKATYLIDILDKNGEIIGQKPRYKVDKMVDIYHSVHAVLATAQGEVVLSMIPVREDLPNIYAGLLGTTMATMRRHGETAEITARRGLASELLITQPELNLIHDDMVLLEDNRLLRISAFLLLAERPELYQRSSIGEVVLIGSDGVDVAMTLHADKFSPTLKAIWPSLHEAIAAR